MRKKRFFALVLALILIISFSGCRNRDDENNPGEPDITEDDRLVIYHNNTELAPMLMALAEEYSSKTGKNLSAQLAGNDFMGEMGSSGAAIYVVDTHSDLSGWHSDGLLSDLLNGSGFSSSVSMIPSGLQLNQNGIGSYGIPLMLEGYGYIFDKAMLRDLFGTSAEALADDLRTCSFTEFEGFVAAVDTYISAPSAMAVTVGGNQYTFAAEKTGKAMNLTGVFSLNHESTRVMEHLLSTGLAAKFAGRYEVMSADENAVSGLENIASAYMEALDLHTSYIAGAKGSIGRGDECTGGDYNYSTSVDLFTKGYALFYPGGTSDAADFEKSSEGFGKELDIIPMKLPLSDEDITAAGMTAEKLQSSIVIGSRYYLALNPKADEKLASAAKDFINWLHDDEAGKTAYSNAFGGVPFNFGYGENNNSSAEGDSPADNAESEAVSSEDSAPSKDTAPSGTGEENKSGAENENSSGVDVPSAPEAENNTSGMNKVPSHSISNSLDAAVAEYYASGNWIPDMASALPGDYIEKILGGSLKDFWGMETWADADRKNFVDTIIGGWKERLDKDNAAVG